MTVFQNLAKKHPQVFGVHTVTSEHEYVGSADFVSFPYLNTVLVSKWFPGYRKTDLTGPLADESISLLLGESMTGFPELEAFRKTLATPSLAAAVIAKLFPRDFAPIKERKYVITEEAIALHTRTILGGAGHADNEPVLLAFTHALTRVLAARGLVAPSKETRIVKVAKSFVIGLEEMRKIVIVDSLRGIFSEQRIQAEMRALNQEVTPLVLGQAVGEMFRKFSMSVPEVILRMEQFDTAVYAARLYNLDPNALPHTLRAHPALQELAAVTNFTLYANDVIADVELRGAAVSEVKVACDTILTVLRSAPSVDMMALSQYPDYFGEVPSSSPDGLRRGLVLYVNYGQKSMMEVADVYPVEQGATMAQVDPVYVRSAGVAAALNTSLLAAESMHGLANIVADELNLQKLEESADCVFDPDLLTIQVSEDDLLVLALAKARSVSYIRTGHAGGTDKLELIFGVAVADQWRMGALAATPAEVFFHDPAAVVMYTSSMVARVPKSYPARAQSIGLHVMDDAHYIGDVEHMLFRGIQEPFQLTIPVELGPERTEVLKLQISVLGHLIGYDGQAYDRGTAYYAAVREPGVDAELNNILQLAMAYAELPLADIQGDKARSWLIIHLAALMKYPATRIMAERAITQAVIEAKIDARRLGAQMKEVYTRAYFGTVLAILNRFGKINGDVVTGLTKAIPTSTLTTQAALLLAEMPGIISPTPTRL